MKKLLELLTQWQPLLALGAILSNSFGIGMAPVVPGPDAIRPPGWAFGIWSIIYSLYFMAYLQWLLLSPRPVLPNALSVTWICNALWIQLSLSGRWILACVVLISYSVAAFSACWDLVQSSSLPLLLTVATILVSFWTLAASAVSVQIAIYVVSPTLWAQVSKNFRALSSILLVTPALWTLRVIATGSRAARGAPSISALLFVQGWTQAAVWLRAAS